MALLISGVVVGTKERRQREFAQREKLFLDTARELIQQDGLLNLSMAKIAASCDYSVGTLYQHFASKEDLLIALATINEQIRLDLFRRVVEWDASTRDRMLGLPVADMQIVRMYPEHFRLSQFANTEVVWGAASALRRQEALACGRPIGELVADLVTEAVECGDLEFKGLLPNELAMAPWTLTLGTHNLVHAEGVLQQYNIRDPYRLMLRHIQSTLNGLEWKPFIDPSDDAALDGIIQRLCEEVFHDLPCQN